MALYRQILGDRNLREGQWGGSVLDSVVGAFLTQNATDALSSQAFMMLMAHYPAQATPRQPPHAHLLQAQNQIYSTPPHMQSLHDGVCTEPHAQGSAVQTDTECSTAQACQRQGAINIAHVDTQPAQISLAVLAEDRDSGLTSSCSQISIQHHSLDSVNWDAVLQAPTEELAQVIRVRGMHNMLALRIQVTQ